MTNNEKKIKQELIPRGPCNYTKYGKSRLKTTKDGLLNSA